MKKFKLIIMLVIMAFSLHFATSADAITLSERDELNKATPGTSKVGLGTIVRSVLAEGVYFMTTDDTGTVLEIPVSVEPSGDTGYVRKFTGAIIGEGSTLPDGSPGQIVTLAFTNDGGQNWVVTPDTASGFRAITFADSGDVATVQFKNTEIGWVVLGTADVSVGPILTVPQDSDGRK